VPGSDDEYLVPSPQELAVATELHAAGVPLPAITGHLRELRGQVEHISERFLQFTTEYVFERFLHHPPNDEEAAEAAALVRRLRPLAQQTLDAELARAMRTLATEHVRRHLDDALLPAPSPPQPPPPASAPAREAPVPAPEVPAPDPIAVPLPAATVAAVRELVGPDQVAAFVAAAADREVAARRMDALADRPAP
jgi:hypothetical protein